MGEGGGRDTSSKNNPTNASNCQDKDKEHESTDPLECNQKLQLEGNQSLSLSDTSSLESDETVSP